MFSRISSIFIVSITLIGLVGVLQASVVFTEISAWAGTWRDNFDDGDFNGWEMSKLFWANNGVIVPDEGNWRVEDGAVVGGDENPAAIYNLLFSEGWSWSDYTVEVSVKLSKPIRKCAANSGVWLYITPEEGKGYGLSVKELQGIEVAGGYTYMAARFQRINKIPFETKANQWYRLKINVERNGSIRCFIDDELISQFLGIRKGAPGFGVNGLVAMFDDFVVTGPGIPNGGPGFKAVHPRDKLTTTWARLKKQR